MMPRGVAEVVAQVVEEEEVKEVAE